MTDELPILVFKAVSTAPESWYDVVLNDVDFAIRAGGLALIRYDAQAPRTPLADAAVGIAELIAGVVTYQGSDWCDLSPKNASANRGTIGRLFGQVAWVNHLDVDENVTLRVRHHTHRKIDEINAEVVELCQAIGLDNGLPSGRPAAVDPLLLQRSACVRLLLGKPKLLIVDEPVAGLAQAVRRMLVPAVLAARQAGAGVLWLTARQTGDDTVQLQPSFESRLFNGQLTVEPT